MTSDIHDLLRRLSANPKDADLLNSIGIAFRVQGDKDAALSYFAQAIAANPRHLQATQNHHTILEELGLTGKLYTNRFMVYHFAGKPWYMPLPDEAVVDAQAATLFDLSQDKYPHIAMNADAQLRLLSELASFHADFAAPGGRYRSDNDQFFETDAAVLYAMMRLKKPKQVIEVGAGFSSAVMLDANDALQRDGKGSRFTVIDPDCSRLKLLLRPGDDATVIEKLVQDVDPRLFADLEAGDILFVDSSHVVKAGSDVNFILGTVLPLLKEGVIIHFHDIFHNFEYPKVWFDKGYPWNEAYTLKHFLMYNSAFRILLFNSWLAHRHGEELFAALPIVKSQWDSARWLERSWQGRREDAQMAWLGGSLWLVKGAA